jgi:methionyl-tRNA formyltransferase
MLFLSKTTDACRAAQRFVRACAPDAIICEGERGDPVPDVLETWTGDYLVSFLSPWIVSGWTLGRATRAAVNLHPGPPGYPGIGCYNFALYDGVTEYGVTCHHMAAQVDTGQIVKVLRMPVVPDDPVALLKERSMHYMLVLFYEVVGRIAAGQPLPRSEEQWRRRPYTRRDLDALCRLTPDMTPEEMTRRVRATTYPGAPGPYLEMNGHRFAIVSSV